MNKKHILILGSTGFIGSQFLKEIESVNSDKYHLHLLVRNKNTTLKSDSNKTVYFGDLRSFEWKKLNDLPDIIYHFARINSSKWRKIGRKIASLQGYFANKKLLKFLNSYDKKKQLFYLSGSLMYGNSEEPITENNKLNPISFAKEYVFAEKPLLKNQDKSEKMKITFIRVPWVLGNGSWFNAFYKNYTIKNGKVPCYGNGENKMSFIILKDLVKCLTNSIEKEYKKTINITYPKYLTQLEFTKIIATKLNIEIEKIKLENKYEKAIIEAFESNIHLTSNHSFLDEILKKDSLKNNIKNEILLIFKNK